MIFHKVRFLGSTFYADNDAKLLHFYLQSSEYMQRCMQLMIGALDYDGYTWDYPEEVDRLGMPRNFYRYRLMDNIEPYLNVVSWWAD